MKNLSTETRYTLPGPTHSNQYLWGPLKNILLSGSVSGNRVFEVGCGNGATAQMLKKHGFELTAIDPSSSGIDVARANYPGILFDEGSAYDDLSSKYGEFPIVVSLEVIEHCFWPRKYASTVYDLLEEGGVAIISTPYHGYFKNIALALANKFDDHWSPLWDGGHIKFWSEKTLRQLLEEVGFISIQFVRVGRIPPFAKSMIAIAQK